MSDRLERDERAEAARVRENEAKTRRTAALRRCVSLVGMIPMTEGHRGSMHDAINELASAAYDVGLETMNRIVLDSAFHREAK